MVSLWDIDTGEALLYASTYALQEFWLLTGDKRSLTALAEAPNCQAIVARLNGKVICLEQIIVHILRSHPFETVLNKIVSARECDTVVKVAFVLGNHTNCKGRVYNCPPPEGSPRLARGTAWGAWVRFPLLAGGTLRRGSTAVFL